jgi:hypothetical protein
MHKFGKKIPMDLETQNQQDFLKFDSELYKNILKSKNNHSNEFESHIGGNLVNTKMKMPLSTYSGDYSNNGFDICMSKAYRRLHKNLV